MAIAQHRLTDQDYEAFVLSGIEGQWELHDGILVEKPAMTLAHSKVFMPMNKRVQGFTMDPLGIHRFDNVDVTE